MKKTINKGEYEYFCIKAGIDDEIKLKLIPDLFENTLYDTLEYFKLRNTIQSIEDLQNVFVKHIGGEVNVGLNYFTLQSDLENIPTELKEAIINNKVAVFVGAGISKLLWYYRWNELADEAINFLNKKGILNFYEADRIKNTISDPKQKLSIFDTYLKGKEQLKNEFYNKAFKQKTTNEIACSLGNYNNPYELLCDDTFGFYKISTNIDFEFASALSDKFNSNEDSIEADNEIDVKDIAKVTSCINPDTYNIEKIEINKINMIHGRLDEPESRIFTTTDYVNHYFSNEGKIKTFLENIFEKFTVLFLGYGLEEFPILESIYNTIKNKNHFTLIPVFSSDINLFHKHEEYYKIIGITPIPYYVDTDGYLRLSKLLNNWKDIIISERLPNSIHNINKISDALNEGQPIENFISLLKNDINAFNYFFKNVKSIEYWPALKAEKYFDADKFPPIKESKEGESQLPQYAPIFYFLEISEKIKSNEISKKYATELIQIIENVTTYFEEKHPNEGNPNTWFKFISILNNLPNESIPFAFLEKNVRHWISTDIEFNYLHYHLISSLFKKFYNGNSDEDQLKSELLIYLYFENLNKNTEKYISSLSGLIFYHNQSDSFSKFSSNFIDYLILQLQFHTTREYIFWIKIKLKGDIYRIDYKLTTPINFDFEYKKIQEDNDNWTDGELVKKGCFKIDIQTNQNMIINKCLEGVGVTDAEILETDFQGAFIENTSFASMSSLFNIDNTRDDEQIDIFITRFLIKILNDKLKSSGKEYLYIIEKLLSEKLHSNMYKRITLVLIANNWELLNDLFTNNFLQNAELAFRCYGIKNEVRDLFKKNSKKLDDNQVDIIESLINNGPVEKEDTYNNEQLKYWQLDWLYSLKSSSYFENWFNNLNNNKYQDYHFSNTGEILYSSPSSPVTENEIHELSNEELISKIVNFKPNNNTFPSITHDSFALKISIAFFKTPKRILSIFKHISELPHQYVYNLIGTCEKVWSESDIRDELPIEKILQILDKYIDDSKNNPDKYFHSSEKWEGSWENIIGQIATFISSGLKNEKDYFQSSVLRIIRKIIIKLVSNISDYSARNFRLNGKQDNQIYNIDYSMNSTQGQVFYSLFYLALRYAKADSVDKDKKLDTDIKGLFNTCFELRVRDAYIIFGTYLPNFIYLDKDYSYEKVNSFLNIEDDLWKCFMGGWLSGFSNWCNIELHENLIPFYNKAIDIGFSGSSRHNKNGLARRIIKSYYWELENINGVSLNYFLKNSTVEDMNQFINYLYYDYRELRTNDKVFPTVIPLWELLHKELLQKVDNKKGLFNSARLICYLENINESSFLRITDALKNIDKGTYLRDFFKQLLRILNNNQNHVTANYIIEILLLISNNHLPDWFDESIEELTEELFKLKNSELNENLVLLCNNVVKQNNGYIDWPNVLMKKYYN